ncbi:MAG: SIS domain-containing protein, partial [Gemmatimonadaceae bacterium]
MSTSPHRTHLHDLAETAQRAAVALEAGIDAAVERFRATVRAGGTLLFCGNGGSAADAQHIATEYMVRYRRNRAP